MSQQRLTIQTSYDLIASEYGEEYFDELANKPLDRQLLNRFAAEVIGKGPVCDMGCGPGQIARYLFEQGVEVIGVDLSQGMVEEARRRNPDIEFKQGDMMALDVEDDAWAGIAAFYSIIHIPRPEVIKALQELRRVLRPGGLLLLTFHIGDEVIHLDEWFGKEVSVDSTFFTREEMEGYLTAAGFEIEASIEREPYEGKEYPSQRAYIFGRKPG